MCAGERGRSLSRPRGCWPGACLVASNHKGAGIARDIALCGEEESCVMMQVWSCVARVSYQSLHCCQVCSGKATHVPVERVE